MSMNARRLYHYTALHHAESIIRDGEIHGGVIPMPSSDGETLEGLAPGWQWLTDDATWRQSWATRVRARCDRTEVRLVIEIPLLAMTRLRHWPKVAEQFGFTPDLARRFAELGGGTPESAAHWYVFRGSIDAGWVVDMERRPLELGAITGRRCGGRR